MPTPTEYIFRSGSCAKKDLYQLIIDELIKAGWKDVASNPAEEYNVMTSTGVNGDKELVIQLRSMPVSIATNAEVTTSEQVVASLRLQTSYIPGEPGVSGVFGRPTLTFSPLHLAAGKVHIDTILNYKVYADKNRIILGIECPVALGYSPVLFYLGQPDTVWMSESKSAGCVSAISISPTTAPSTLIVCDTPDGMASSAGPYGLTTKTLLPLKNPNNDGRYITSDIIYESTTEGMRGKLDGILCATNSNILTGDRLIENGKTYYVFNCHLYVNSSFPSQAIIVRIE